MYSAEDLKIARIKAKIKAIDMAHQLKISPGTLSLMENGYKKIPDKFYRELVEVLHDYL